MHLRLEQDFFDRDCLAVAPDLVGKRLVRKLDDGCLLHLRITETEAYRGQEDTACHAHRGRTPRTEVLYGRAGTVYVYLCYGIHHLLNIITGPLGHPQGVLIRACEQANGPGKLTKHLQIDKARFNCEDITECPQLWIEDDGMRYEIITRPRVGIDYAAPEDRDRLWRFCMGAPI